jgi:hypothetical protein
MFNKKGKSTSSFEGPPISAAVEYAKTLHSDLLKEFDDSSRKRIAQIISDGIRNKSGLPKMSKLIRNEFTITKELADKLVLTETNWALSHASLDRMERMGIKGKESVLSGGNACEVCKSNFDKGIIPIDKPFPSGHASPPFHDGCTCSLAPALPNEG